MPDIDALRWIETFARRILFSARRSNFENKYSSDYSEISSCDWLLRIASIAMPATTFEFVGISILIL